MTKFIKSVLSGLFAVVFLLTVAGSLSSCSYNDFVYSFVDIIQLGMWLDDVPEPEIKYAEFPFTLTYEVNGETKIIQDSIVCEFDGFEVLGAAGKYRKWKIYLKGKPEQVDRKSSRVRITLLDLSNSDEHDQYGNQMLELYFSGGKAEYYMGDDLWGVKGEAQDFDIVYYSATDENGVISRNSFTAEEAMEKYKIRLLSWEVAKPIVNSFS